MQREELPPLDSTRQKREGGLEENRESGPRNEKGGAEGRADRVQEIDKAGRKLVQM